MPQRRRGLSDTQPSECQPLVTTDDSLGAIAGVMARESGRMPTVRPVQPGYWAIEPAPEPAQHGRRYPHIEADLAAAIFHVAWAFAGESGSVVDADGEIADQLHRDRPERYGPTLDARQVARWMRQYPKIAAGRDNLLRNRPVAPRGDPPD